MTAAPGATTDRGELAIVLHSHMPYVEGFGTWPFGEEWLWEALATVYLPLLEAIREAPVTVGLTPVLCDQLETLDGEAGERFVRFLREVRAPIHAEEARAMDAAGEPELAAELRRAATDYTNAARRFEETGGKLLERFSELAARGRADLWTGPASHCVLPLLATDAGLRLQVGAGVAAHERRFGDWGGGFWLPECAYREGLERDLAPYGVQAFCVDQTSELGLGSLDHLEPIATEGGPVAIPIDWQLVKLVWDGATGYPTTPRYRDYHHRTTYHMKPWAVDGAPYRHYEALVVARQHARDFVGQVLERLDAYRAERGRAGLVCVALDTELLGHWWYEGQHWLRFVIDEAHRQGLPLATLPEAIERHPPVARAITPSTWGRGKDMSTWDAPDVAALTFAARKAELRTVAAAAVARSSGALERSARELLALQSSDWAFQTSQSLAGDYPRERAEGHSAALDDALEAIAGRADSPDPSLRNLAPNLDVSALFGI